MGGLEEEGDNAVLEQISMGNSVVKGTEGPGSEAGTEGATQPNSATPSIVGHGGDPEASNASTVPGSTVPGTPAENAVIESSQSGPNYAFIDPLAEDTMIVQYILASRMGTR